MQYADIKIICDVRSNSTRAPEKSGEDYLSIPQVYAVFAVLQRLDSKPQVTHVCSSPLPGRKKKMYGETYSFDREV